MLLNGHFVLSYGRPVLNDIICLSTTCNPVAAEGSGVFHSDSYFLLGGETFITISLLFVTLVWHPDVTGLHLK